MAEDALSQAGTTVGTCLSKPAPVANAVIAPLPPPPAAVITPAVAAATKPQPQPFEFQANVLFNYDRHQADQARAMTLERLDRAIARAGEAGSTLLQVQLVGLADYNEALAHSRVQTVSRLLQDKGIVNTLISTAVRGEPEPVRVCQGRFASRADELECLLKNRRVEVNFITARTR